MKARTALAALPLALALGNEVARAPFVAGTPPAATSSASARKPAGKVFTIPLSNLRNWAETVIVTLDGVTVEGRSKDVHALTDDCELHFGAHASGFQGEPDGLVLEPMNACVQPFFGKTEHSNADWKKFGDDIKGKEVTVSGVPRIWPEHLTGGGDDSNPNHAVELHPLTSVVFAGKTFDFAPNVFAGDYVGGLGEESALKIVKRTTVSVTRNGDSVDISVRAGTTIGNFTVLEIVIDRASITSDRDGSFRMDGEVDVDDSTTVPVRIVTTVGSPINNEMKRIKSGRRASVSMKALVLFSLSPNSLLDAANQSNGDEVAVERPIQLILFGPPNSD